MSPRPRTRRRAASQSPVGCVWPELSPPRALAWTAVRSPGSAVRAPAAPTTLTRGCWSRPARSGASLHAREPHGAPVAPVPAPDGPDGRFACPGAARGGGGSHQLCSPARCHRQLGTDGPPHPAAIGALCVHGHAGVLWTTGDGGAHQRPRLKPAWELGAL